MEKEHTMSKNGKPTSPTLSREQLEKIRREMITYSKDRLNFDLKTAERVGALAIEVLTQDSKD